MSTAEPVFKSVQSDHPYNAGDSISKLVFIPCALKLVINFDARCSTEPNVAILSFYASETAELPLKQFSGPPSQFKSFTIENNRFYVKFVADINSSSAIEYFGILFHIQATFQPKAILKPPPSTATNNLVYSPPVAASPPQNEQLRVALLNHYDISNLSGGIGIRTLKKYSVESGDEITRKFALLTLTNLVASAVCRPLVYSNIDFGFLLDLSRGDSNSTLRLTSSCFKELFHDEFFRCVILAFYFHFSIAI